MHARWYCCSAALLMSRFLRPPSLPPPPPPPPLRGLHHRRSVPPPAPSFRHSTVQLYVPLRKGPRTLHYGYATYRPPSEKPAMRWSASGGRTQPTAGSGGSAAFCRCLLRVRSHRRGGGGGAGEIDDVDNSTATMISYPGDRACSCTQRWIGRDE